MTDWLLGTLLATSGLILLVLLIREPVRRMFGARVAYSLWLIPAARLLMPTLIRTVERPVAEGASVRPFSETIAQPLMMPAVSSPELSFFEQVGGWQTVLLVLWLGIALGLFIARMTDFGRARAAILAEADEIGRFGSIRLVRSARARGPLAFGIIDRVIAVPADFERRFGAHERRLALEHELAHHRSGDLVANFIAFGLLCLQWFNPLAWVAHAAFRFDQEAACDARVLDKAKPEDRADYGRAIAKAASGRALLFASALDRRNNLYRRLKSMVFNPTPGRRIAGRLMVLAAVAMALPLTATRAIDYVDVPAPAAPQAPKAPLVLAALAVQPAEAVAPMAPVPPIAPVTPVAPMASLRINDDTIHINGKAKKWSELTPAEKTEIRRSIAEAKQELGRSRVEMQREMREARQDHRINMEQLRRDMAESRAEIAKAMREVDSNAAAIRRSGQDPESIKATIRASLRAVEAIDVEAITRQAMAAVNPSVIEASLAAAEASIEQAEDEVERVQERLEKDDDD